MDPIDWSRFVGQAEIAERLGLTKGDVHAWTRQRAVNKFPEPVVRWKMGPLYEWAAVQKWFETERLARIRRSPFFRNVPPPGLGRGAPGRKRK